MFRDLNGESDILRRDMNEYLDSSRKRDKELSKRIILLEKRISSLE